MPTKQREAGFTTAEIAGYYRDVLGEPISERTVRRMCHDGRMEATQYGPRGRIFVAKISLIDAILRYLGDPDQLAEDAEESRDWEDAVRLSNDRQQRGETIQRLAAREAAATWRDQRMLELVYHEAATRVDRGEGDGSQLLDANGEPNAAYAREIEKARGKYELDAVRSGVFIGV